MVACAVGRRVEADRVVCRRGARVSGDTQRHKRKGDLDAQKRRKKATAQMTEYGISPMSCVRPNTTGEYILELDSRTKVARL